MITHVAIKDRYGKIWSLPKPNRHGHVIHKMHVVEGKEVALYLLGEQIQGFLNDKGMFLNRLEAFQEAFNCIQLLPPYNPINPKERRGEVNTNLRELFSEDLW